MNDENNPKIERKQTKKENTARIFFFLWCIAFFLWVTPGSLGSEISVCLMMIIVGFLLIIFEIKNTYKILIILWNCALWWIFWLLSYSEHTLDESIFLEKIHQNNQKFHVEGIVDSVAYKGDFSTTYILSIDMIANWYNALIKDSSINFDILVEVPSNLKIYPWESIEFESKLNAISLSWDDWFKKYAFWKWIYGKAQVTTFIRKNSTDKWIILTIQEQAKQAIFRWFPREEAGVILGMVLWNIDLITKNLKEQFLLSWTTHILVVSGSNIAFVMLIMSMIFRYISLWRILQIIIMILSLLWYWYLVWWDTPVIRATLMGGVSFFAIEYGKKISSTAIILLIGFVLVWINPFSLAYDPGFWLSFGATIAIILYHAPLEKILITIKIPKIVSSILAVTFSATIGSLPATIYHFWVIATGSIVSNLLISVAVWCIMILWAFYIISSLIWGYFLYSLGYLVYLPTTYILTITDIFAKYPVISIPENWKNIISIALIGYISAYMIEREMGTMRYQKGHEQ